MKNTVLLEALSANDRAIMESYINNFGVIKDNFIGLDKWLQFWSYSKQRLFKLLGNQLIYRTDISYEKDNDTLEDEISGLLLTHRFRDSYHCFFLDVIRNYYKQGIIDEDTKHGFSRLTDCSVLINDAVQYPIKMRKPNCKKELQIPKGMKPMRAFSKIISYFKDDYNFTDFEDFRIKHSMILNDKYIKGKLCLSIHPQDFMTMSDNANDWSSCMSWRDDGCYHLGTVEMMNSNNVLCCYIESDRPFSWEDNETGECVSWNSKKFRVLAYVTKDIIVNGKSYPYQNRSVVKIIIDEIRNLAKKNLGWTYTFGPELYKDMIHINFAGDMERNRDWIRWNQTTKHNIIFDTNAMYNDMFNDNVREYWCYRNKVKRNKVINISGKANCLCCNGDVKEVSGEYDYNDRFNNSGSVICYDCKDTFKCYQCGSSTPTTRQYKVTFKYKNGESITKTICKNCWNKYVKICPDCGKPYINDYFCSYKSNTIKKYGEVLSRDYSEKEVYVLKTDEGYFYDNREAFVASCINQSSCMESYAIENKEREGILVVESTALHKCKPCEDYLSTIEEVVVPVKNGWRYSSPVVNLIPEKIMASKYTFHALKTPEWHPDFVFEME